ncbi:hypothetical protein EFK50_17595 [Nocardioides marmoriginsengisoli]|uniref:Uncharacterized protein n=1 Tax=Nocardioides marmoriginsengisoli TaxID=661483 RepID=A0A3N0CCM7_9ACTN|nr:hypothetical protein [Nocardioides marmoriginsengisoli]RNL61185.1 hypothetical protein EFK50_17595 [Nocardioides marmoriginsengisoli]
MSRYAPALLLRLLLGCVVLGIGVGLLLTADLGSDGYSTLVSGIARSSDWAFVVANIAVSLVFLVAAALRKVRPDVGTVVQIVVVGYTVTLVLKVLDTPASTLSQAGCLVLALPVLSLGVAMYLGTNLGAGPAEAAALAWDPPLPFRWSYSILQGGGAVIGWLLGASVGVGTVVVILLLGPLVDLAARVLRVELTQTS